MPAGRVSGGGKTTPEVTVTSKMSPTDFEFENQLGVGSFSKVVVGFYKPTGVRYAVKMIAKRAIVTAATEEERVRMAEVARREARMLLLCRHPNIIRFYASMQTPDDLLYVTEFCEGGELLHVLSQRGRIPLEATRYAIAELFSAVLYLHSAPKVAPFLADGAAVKPVTILHRDIKPENIVLTRSKHIRLIDFGTAVMCDSVTDRTDDEKGRSGRAQTFCGTTNYMSPELLSNSYTCCASDYWGVGCVLYHMLVGRRPFEASTPYLLLKAILEQEPEYGDDMDPHARDLVQRLLVKSPEKRITAAEVRAHPFFAPVDFDLLPSLEVEDLWIKETPWVDETKKAACHACRKVFIKSSEKKYCRSCGNIFCLTCVSKKCIIPASRFETPQCVCDFCSNKLNNAGRHS